MRINFHGTVVSNDDAWIYDWFEMDYVSPRSVSRQLEQANGDDIELYVNSPGGDVWAGSEIYTILREYPGNIIAKVVGVAASAASVAICGAKTVFISPTAQVMVHRSATEARGNKNAFDQTSQMLNSVDEGILNAYEAKTGKNREELIALMDGETFFSAQEAVANGFADEIMFAHTEKVVASVASALLPSELINKIKTKLIKANLAPSDLGNVPVNTPTPPVPVASVTTNTQTPKEGEGKMTYEELVAQHPELVDTISQAAVTAERNRISSLSQMEGAPGAEPFIKAAILSGETAGDVAMKIVQASAQRQTQEGANRQADAEASGVNAVANQAPPAKPTDKEKQDAIVASLAARTAAMQKKGGK
ncbi:Clp protease ClpP [Paenibacillus xylanexedens]|uniref:head maturation protease, ClpP-related n=1 Tax=Paenibacillus xylanexedens TaxID=528191 RepID=UPI001F3EAEA6|nr:head maturation protease, ClpP-related [Paenibacillus xylanexedens]MCF7753364.1 Clp protease ClpP [Paenibacillus xylanexedens]